MGQEQAKVVHVKFKARKLLVLLRRMPPPTLFMKVIPKKASKVGPTTKKVGHEASQKLDDPAMQSARGRAMRQHVRGLGGILGLGEVN